MSGSPANSLTRKPGGSVIFPGACAGGVAEVEGGLTGVDCASAAPVRSACATTTVTMINGQRKARVAVMTAIVPAPRGCGSQGRRQKAEGNALPFILLPSSFCLSPSLRLRAHRGEESLRGLELHAVHALAALGEPLAPLVEELV